MCLFCKIIEKQVPAEIVYEDDFVLAFKDIAGQAPFHILIIPKQHISTINDLNEENSDTIGKLYLVAKKIAKDYGYIKKGYRVVMNCNKGAGQTVFHIHLHMLAGRPLSWPPG